MKKIANVNYFNIGAYDSTNYIIIEENRQHISDKYVDSSGNKINSYGTLKKCQLIIRQLYSINFSKDYCHIHFTKFRHYSPYNPQMKNKIYKYLNTKNSIFFYEDIGGFDIVKKRIVSIFLKIMEVKII